MRLVGDHADKGYVRVTEYTSFDEPIPCIEIGVELDMEKIVDYIDRLGPLMEQRNKRQ